MIVYLLISVLVKNGHPTKINVDNLVFKEAAACEKAVKKLEAYYSDKYDDVKISCSKEEVINKLIGY